MLGTLQTRTRRRGFSRIVTRVRSPHGALGTGGPRTVPRHAGQYTHAGDRFQLDEFVSALLRGRRPRDPWRAPLVGRAAILERFRGGIGIRPHQARRSRPAGAKRIVRHNVTNLRFESLTPQEATVASYFTVFTNVGADHMGRYRDRLVPVGDDWLIAHRYVSTDWHAPDASSVRVHDDGPMTHTSRRHTPLSCSLAVIALATLALAGSRGRSPRRALPSPRLQLSRPRQRSRATWCPRPRTSGRAPLRTPARSASARRRCPCRPTARRSRSGTRRQRPAWPANPVATYDVATWLPRRRSRS